MTTAEPGAIAHSRGLVATNLSLKAQVEMLRTALASVAGEYAIQAWDAWRTEREERLVSEDLARSRLEELCLLKQER